MADKCLIVGDIGGTNARFALANQAHPGFHDVIELKCGDYETSGDAIRYVLEQFGVSTADAMCLAAAGPVVDGSVNMTNNHWVVSSEHIASEFDVDAVRLLNDFEAIAYSLPFLAAEDRTVVGVPQGVALTGRDFNVAVLGPGTGLGVAGLIGRDKRLIPITGEGGHVAYAPETELQSKILRVLRSRWDRVSAERLVAGSGLENIYAALADVRNEPAESLSAPEVFRSAADSSSLAGEAVGVFFEIMGQVAGDLALTLGAWDGVYIAGGIAKRYPDILAASRFRTAFESKGRHSHIVERVPTYLITHDQPGLLGASYLAQELGASL
ncbi:MAG: glucokinase [Woeseiaceae bacterium]|nr:glucokinase [Woeseiaceae bacterium]